MDCLDPTGRKVVEPHDDLYPVLKTYGGRVGGVSCVVSSLYCSIDIKTGGMARGGLPREVWFSQAVIFSVVRTSTAANHDDLLRSPLALTWLRFPCAVDLAKTSVTSRLDCRLGGYVVLWGELALDQEPLPGEIGAPLACFAHFARLDFVFSPSSPTPWIIRMAR